MKFNHSTLKMGWGWFEKKLDLAPLEGLPSCHRKQEPLHQHHNWPSDRGMKRAPWQTGVGMVPSADLGKKESICNFTHHTELHGWMFLPDSYQSLLGCSCAPTRAKTHGTKQYPCNQWYSRVWGSFPGERWKLKCAKMLLLCPEIRQQTCFWFLLWLDGLIQFNLKSDTSIFSSFMQSPKCKIVWLPSPNHHCMLLLPLNRQTAG